MPKILVIDDNPIMRRLIRLALEGEGLHVVEAEDAKSGIALAERERPDLILQDLILPDLDGLELLPRLRALPWPKPVPILALSGFVTRLDEARVTGAGFDDLLVKPVAPARLLEVIRSHLPGSTAPRPGAGCRVLLADDDPVQRKLAALQLGRLGFEVETACDGAEALERARQQLPDIVVSDVFMPRLDGFELCLELRRDPHLRRVPIVLFSASFVDDAERKLGLDAGANAYVCRTGAAEDLTAVVLENLRRAPPPTGSVPTPVESRDSRVTRQLDRQIAANADLVRQLRMQRASIEVLGGIADALANTSDPASALRDAFLRCVDASGLGRGVLVLRTEAGRRWIAARCGYESGRDGPIADALDAAELAPQMAEAAAFFVRPGTPGAARLLEALEADAVIVAPIIGGGERYGKILLTGSVSPEAQAQVLWFAHQVALHVGQALALAGAFQTIRRSEERYRALVTQASDAIALISLDGVIHEANDRMAQLAGLSREAVIGRHFLEFTVPEDREQHLTRFAAIVAQGEGIVEGARLLQPDRSERLADVAVTVIQTMSKPMLLTIARDVTERTRQAQELQQSEERFRQLAEGVREAFFVIDLDGDERTLRYVSPQVAAVFGRPPAFFFDGPAAWLSIVHPDDRAHVAGFLSRPSEHRLAFRYVTLGGGVRHAEIRCTLIRAEHGEIVRLVGVADDVTEPILAMLALEARARLASFTADVSVAFSTESLSAALQHTAELAVADLDAALARIWLYQTENGEAVLRLVASAGLYTHLDGAHARIPVGAFKIGHIAASRQPHLTNDLRRDPHVDQAWVQAQGLTAFAGYPLLVGDRLVGAIGIFGRRPLDQRTLDALSGVGRVAAIAVEAGRSGAEALRAETRFRDLIEAAPDLMFVFDADGAGLFANRAWRDTLGWTEPAPFAQTLSEVVAAECAGRCREAMQALFDGAASTPVQGTLVARDGREVLVEGTMNRVAADGAFRAIAIFRDVTERRRMELALRDRDARVVEMQKLEAIGQLAGGVAHDFNNLMGIVLACGDFALSELPADHPVREDVLEMRRAGERAAALTRQLLAYARRQILEPRVVDPNETIAEMTKMLRRTVGDDIEVVVALEPDVRHVLVDPGQLEQVILNLVVNARDAMPHGGTITLSTARAAPGTVIAVSDTGTGMDEATQRRLFEPFFTTKPAGRGTGLGLATSYGIIRQSGGTIAVESRLGEGTTFTIVLPETVRAPDSAAPAFEARVAGGDETILILEDQLTLRRAIARTLRKIGYTVIEAGTADEARAVAGAHAASIGLVLSDVVTPGGGATRAVRDIVAGHPGCATLFMSGYADANTLDEVRLPAGVPFIHKPFAPEALARKVREVLDAPRAPGA